MANLSMKRNQELPVFPPNSMKAIEARGRNTGGYLSVSPRADCAGDHLPEHTNNSSCSGKRLMNHFDRSGRQQPVNFTSDQMQEAL